jgi:hypothetical protein
MHDLVVRDLGRARNWTLGLTGRDEPTLVVPGHHCVDVADGIVTVTDLEA